MLPKQFKQVTCKKCGTVYIAVSRVFAELEIASSAIFLKSLSKKDKELYQSDLTIASYEYCWCKNHYKNFRAFKKGDCPDGCTLSSIIRKAD